MPETPSGYFPDYDIQWDVKIGRRYKTNITVSKTGKEQRRKMYPSTGSEGTGHKGGYGIMTASSGNYDFVQRQIVADFLDSKDGAFRAFYLFRRDRDNFINYDVGSVATQSSIIIPFKDSVVTSVTVADVSKAFTVTPLIGAGGEDRINFTDGNQSGIVRATLRGRERWVVRCENDDVVEAFIQNVTSQKAIFNLAFKQLRS